MLHAAYMCTASALVSLLLCYVGKTSEACCYETATEAAERQAKVKIPLSLPEILYWKPQIHGTEPYRLSSSATRLKLHRKMCVCFCYGCVGMPNMLFGVSFGSNHDCNQVSCGFHSEKSKAKINDLQQVAMAVNKHLMNALSCLGFGAF